MSKVILFDGECLFCDKSVQFIIKHDPYGIYKFASLQSEIGLQLKRKLNIPESIDSIVLIDNNTYYLQSTAVLRLCQNLSGIWKLFYYLIYIPVPLRDSIYKLVAKKRYKWFGKKESCELPSTKIRNRFL